MDTNPYSSPYERQLAVTDPELYESVKDAHPDALEIVARASMTAPKPAKYKLVLLDGERVPVLTLTDRLWQRHNKTSIAEASKTKVTLAGKVVEVPTRYVLVFSTLFKEKGRTNCERQALIIWQLALLEAFAKEEKLEYPTHVNAQVQAHLNQIKTYVGMAMR